MIVERLETMYKLLLSRNRLVTVIIVVLAITAPYLASTYTISLLIEVLIFSIFAMSLNLLVGYTGLPSFGHAAFFGLGAYIIAYVSGVNNLTLSLTNNILLTLPIVVIGTGTIALIIGSLALRTDGIYFLMITLAFAQMLFSVAMRWSAVTGGSDGLIGIPRPEIDLGVWKYSFESRTAFYYFVVTTFVTIYFGLHNIIHSPFGLALKGIKSNQMRMQALGYKTLNYKIGAFVIAGVIAGIAGMLLAQFYWHASPENLYWTMSGQALIMVILGGVGTLIGPVIGATLMRLLPNITSTYTNNWQSYMGIMLIIFVLCAPNGIMGILFQKLKNNR